MMDIHMELPGSWRCEKLGALLREPLRNGHSSKGSKDGGGIRTLTLTAVTVGDFSDSNTKLTNADPDRVRNLWLKNGDIFIERSNTPELVGTARLYSGPDDYAIFPDLLIRVWDSSVFRLDQNGSSPTSARDRNGWNAAR